MDEYFKRIPKNENDVFYLRPLTKVDLDDSSATWFTNVPVGRNKLGAMIHDMCKNAKIGGNKTNHSLHATGATELYNAGVPEKIIKERTGHRSLEALRMYETTSEKQHKAVANILSSDRETSFNS